MHRGLGAYALRQADRRNGRKPHRQSGGRGACRCWNRGARYRRDRARPLQRWLLGPGLHRFAGAAGLARFALQTRDPGGECLRHGFGRGASGSESDRGQIRAHRAGGRRRANDGDAGRRNRPQPFEGIVCSRGSRHRGRLRRRFRPDRRALFPALGRPVGCVGANRRQKPQERRRQSLRADPQRPRLRILPHRERQESARRGAAETHRLLTRLRWRRCFGAHRCRDRTETQESDRVPRRRARAGFPADVAARHSQVRRLRRRLAARA